MVQNINIAIDGPSGAGKSTVAKICAEKLGFIYVDTGALYRTVGVCALNKGIDTKDKNKIIDILPDVKIDIKYIDGVQHVFTDGDDVSEEIRQPEASMAASDVGAISEVRQYLLSVQRNIAKENNIVMDGRDIGTTILPNAQYKFFLTASPEVRADRRYKEQKEKGIDEDYDTLLEEIKQRDYQDTHRKISPLKQADDAILINSDNMTIEEVVNFICSKVKA